MSEGQSRRAWRRRVADYILRQVDHSGFARFVGLTPEDRREMLKVAEMLPRDIEVEIFEDSRYPGRTYLEVRMHQQMPAAKPSFKVVYPEEATGS
ncbi:MAG: hypothetical protein KQH83_04030 [Actinobacteria bacterium]|nr:hypothetical protein [Actinomycetota bacterium]